MIFLAAMADDRWMGSMKMLSASDPEIIEKRSDTVEKLCVKSNEYIQFH